MVDANIKVRDKALSILGIRIASINALLHQLLDLFENHRAFL